MSPRKILGTVPAAFVANFAITASSSDNAQALGGVASTSFLRSDQVDTATSLLTFSGGLVSTASSTILNLTTTNATTTNLVINGTLKDSLNSVGTNGFILRTTGAGTQWVATSSLGLSTAFTNSAGLAALLSDESGTGVVAFTTNPVFTTPNLGTPSAATLTNATGLPIVAGTTGTLSSIRGGTGIASYVPGDLLYASGVDTLANRSIGTTGQVLQVVGGMPTWSGTTTLGLSSSFTNSAQLAALLSDESGTGSVAFTNSPTFVNPNLGTPSAATLTNATGLPISTGVSGLGTGVATFLSTPSSANLITAVTNETGTGNLVFSASPTFTGTATFINSSSTNASTTNLSVANNAYFGGNTGIWNGSGNVGIGTTSPSAKLDLRAVPFSANQANGILFGNTSNTGWDSSIFLRSNAGGSPRLSLSGPGTTDNLVIFSGNIGIGTSSPATLLSVVGTSTLRNVIPEGPYSSNISTYSLGASNARWGNVWTEFINLGTSTWSIAGRGASQDRFAIFDGPSGTGSERFSISNNGNVGIGATLPATTLHVAGSALIRTSAAGAGAANTLPSEATYLQVVDGTAYNASPSVSFTLGASNYDAMNTNGTYQYSLTTPGDAGGAGLAFNKRQYNGSSVISSEVMRIAANGNVAIGTTTPSQLFTVGSTTANQFTVSNTGVVNVANLTASRLVATDGSDNLVSTITSANLGASVSDESGTGTVAFTNSPTFVNPSLGTPASATLTNATGLPLTTGVTGTLAVGNGGTGATTLGAGQVLVGNGTGAITSTTTANLKITLGLNNVENTALSTWAGTTNITTLGTITSGTWNGTAIAGTRGGTGLTSVTQNQLLIGGAGNTWTQIATSSLGYSASFTNSAGLAALLSDESGTGVVAFTTSPVFTTPNLGTPSAVTLTNATGLPIVAGTTGTLSTTRGGTGLASYTTGDLIYASGANTLANRAIGTTGQILQVVGGVPTWSATSSLGIGGVTSVSGSGGTTGLTLTGGPITTSGTLTLGGTLAVANGGTGITSFGAGVAAFLGTPSSANLITAVTNETGTGNLVFSAAPTFTGNTILANASTTNLTVSTNAHFGGNTGIWNSSGNVGIGTSTPFSTLTIQGSANYGQVDIVSATTNQESGIIFKSADDTDAQGWLIGKNVGLSDDSFSIFRGANYFSINPAGNVGIGSTTPTGKLGVAGEIYSNNLLIQGDNTNAYIRPRNSGSILSLGAADTNYMSISAAGVVNVVNLTASRLVATDASKNLVSTITSANLAASISDETGTGNAVFSASPTFTGNTTLANASTTHLTVSGTAHIAGTILFDNTRTIAGRDNGGVSRTAIIPRWSDNAMYIDGGTGGMYLRTNDSAINAMRIDGAGVVTINNLSASRLVATDGSDQLVSTITSANMAASISDETGSGLAVFATSPSLTTPNIGAATASNLSVTGGSIQLSGSTAPGISVTPTSGSAYVFGANTGLPGAGIYDTTAATWRLVVRDTTGNIGIGTTAPRNPLHVQLGGNGSYAYIQSGTVTSGTLLSSTDTIPVVSSNGFVGYNGLAIIPQRWGTAGGTADAHNVLYLAGVQRNSGAGASSIAFANWAYFTGTGTGAGGLGNATAQADAVKFNFEQQDLGSEFNQRLNIYSRRSTGVNGSALAILSNGNVGIGNEVPGSALSVGSIGTLREVSVGMQNTLFRMRERTTSNDFALSTNINDGAAQDNASYASWVNRFGGGTDTWSVARSAPGSGSLTTLVDINGAGNLRAIGEVQSTMATGFGQFRSITGNYGFIERNDGSNYYMLLTNSGNQYGIWNDLRPFTMNLATGNITLATTSISTTLGVTGAVSLGSTLNVNGAISGNSKEMFLTTDTYLRMNQSSTFSSGIYIGNSNFFGFSGIFAMGSNGGTTDSRVTIKSGTHNGTNVIDLDGATGNITAAGTINGQTISSAASFTGTVSAGGIYTGGASSGFNAGDRSTSGSSIFYRNAGVNRLWDSTYGDVITFNGSGVVTVPTLTVSGVSTLSTAAFGATTGDKLQLYSNTYGIGIESSTLTNWSGSQFRWRTGGASVSGGTEQMLLTTGGLTLAGTLGVGGNISGTTANLSGTLYTSGRVTSNGALPTLGTIGTSTGGLGAFEAISSGSGGTAGAAFITFHRPSAFATYLGIDTDNALKVGGWSNGANAYPIWHSGMTASGIPAATLLSKVSGTTGTGNLVFATSPTLTTPNIGGATGSYLTLNTVNDSGLYFINTGMDTSTGGRFRLNPYSTVGLIIQEFDSSNNFEKNIMTFEKETGQVGINTNSPSTYLDVNGSVTISNAQDGSGNLRFTAANPFIYASSYIQVLNGMYVSGGTFYAQNNANFRGGITNDTAAALQINGGTSGYTYINGRLGIGDSVPVSYLSINPNNDGLTNTSSASIVGNSTTLGTGAAAYLYPSEIQGAAGSVIRLQDTLYRRVAGSGWEGTAYRMQYAVDNSFTDGSKAFVEVGAGDPTDSGGGFVALATNGVIRISADNVGDVAIGADTSATRLDVVETRYGGLGVDVFRVRSNYYGGVDTVFRVDALGNVYSDGGTAMGSPADIAENFPASEPVATGMVVAFSTSTTQDWSLDARATSTTFLRENTFDMATVRKARYANEAVGVVSTRPGVLLSANTENGVPVALSGRVPVKVTTENGLIKIGDYLTVSSSTPGYAMKATGSGPTIGQAISNYDHNQEQVLVFVENGYENLTEDGSRRLNLFDTLSDNNLAAILTLTGTSTTLNAFGETETIWSRLVTLADNFVDGILSVLTLKAERVETGEINTDKLCLDGVCITADEFRQLLDNNLIGGQTPTSDGDDETNTGVEDVDENTDTNTGSSTEEVADEGEETTNSSSTDEGNGGDEEEVVEEEGDQTGGDNDTQTEENPGPEEGNEETSTP